MSGLLSLLYPLFSLLQKDCKLTPLFSIFQIRKLNLFNFLSSFFRLFPLSPFSLPFLSRRAANIPCRLLSSKSYALFFLTFFPFFSTLYLPTFVFVKGCKHTLRLLFFQILLQQMSSEFVLATTL